MLQSRTAGFRTEGSFSLSDASDGKSQFWVGRWLREGGLQWRQPRTRATGGLASSPTQIDHPRICSQVFSAAVFSSVTWMQQCFLERMRVGFDNYVRKAASTGLGTCRSSAPGSSYEQCVLWGILCSFSPSTLPLP